MAGSKPWQYFQMFLKSYTTEFLCSLLSNEGNKFGFCVTYACDVSISHGRNSDIKVYIASKKHQRYVRDADNQPRLKCDEQSPFLESYQIPKTSQQTSKNSAPTPKSTLGLGKSANADVVPLKRKGVHLAPQAKKMKLQTTESGEINLVTPEKRLLFCCQRSQRSGESKEKAVDELEVEFVSLQAYNVPADILNEPRVDKPAYEREMTNIEEEGSDDSTKNGAAEQMAQNTLLNQSRLEATMRRAALSKDLEELNRVLQAKEELASKIAMNDQHLDNWLQNELLVVSGSKMLEHHLSSLIEEHKAIANEINTVEKQLKNPDMAEDRSVCNTRVQELKCTLQEHTDKIAELQKKILDVDPERHIKHFASIVMDIVESRAIATSLFEMCFSPDELQPRIRGI
ncbi:hypothetical protein HPB50_028199 [Hyalomma asiaticum]|nr:hypothetical protein HPB50_028199 [Hyalomma asiaticum]